MMNSPLVSISCITYNHKEFIRDCLDGFISQECSFGFEVLIYDDASTDGTQEIIKEYQQKYPTIVKPIFQTENQYSKGFKGIMAHFNFSRARGKYIALCEGDDYWTDTLKLEKQVEIMETDKNCNLVFTDIHTLQEETGQVEDNWAVINKSRIYFKDLIKKNVISTCTVLFRNQSSIILLDWIKKFKIGDYPLYLFLLKDGGYAYYIQKKTAVYRQHKSGIFSLKGKLHLIETNINTLKRIQRMGIKIMQRLQVRRSLLKWIYGKGVLLSNDKRANEIRPFFTKEIKTLDIIISPSYFFRIVLLYIFPSWKSTAFGV